MGEPRAITYKEVEKAVGEGSRAVWEKVGEISGAGLVPLDASGNASIDLTEASESVRSRIDKLLVKEDEAVVIESKAVNNKKEGGK